MATLAQINTVYGQDASDSYREMTLLFPFPSDTRWWPSYHTISTSLLCLFVIVLCHPEVFTRV